MEGMRTDHASVGGDAYDGARRHGTPNTAVKNIRRSILEHTGTHSDQLSGREKHHNTLILMTYPPIISSCCCRTGTVS
jgi:hypothetical protein